MKLVLVLENRSSATGNRPLGQVISIQVKN